MAQPQVAANKGKKKRKVPDTSNDLPEIGVPVSLSFKTLIRSDNK